MNRSSRRGFLAALLFTAAVVSAPAEAGFIRGGGGVYPPSIVRAGLQAVWDLQQTGATGPRVPVTSIPTTPGAVVGTKSAPFVFITASQTITGVDFTGWNVLVDANAVVVFNDCIDGNVTPSTYFFSAGSNSGTTNNVTFNYCEFNFATTAASDAGGNAARVSSITLFRCRMRNASCNYWDTAGPFAMSESYVTAGGLKATFASHIELVHSQGAVTVSITNNMIDITAAAAVAASWDAQMGFTAALYASTGLSGDPDTTATITGNVIIGPKAIEAAAAGKCAYTIAIGHPGGLTAVHATISNNVMDMGGSGYVATETGSTTTGSGNRDFTTGNLFSVP